ncbi:hypothetical protein CKO15_05950 [Halorhodospira abdelmalekii]|uniref:flagellar basal body L-ring protein FlgH n=1 Tax=Halorhodospira abdelmalekii TaxID=421629 RepID=UPI0019069F2F|nr:flagellar basal body L-ring protein FlgH [Halorhodospira abdelmalekii]MBK1734838.1 hypothetical protein [Halorhodospira abdelmalekii]
MGRQAEWAGGLLRAALVGALLAVLGGCAGTVEPPENGPSPITAPRVQLPDLAESPRGALFDEDRRMRLFEDRSARRPGDVITVIVEEEISGSRSVNANMFRQAEGDLQALQIGGEEFEVAGRPMTFQHGGEANFDGGGDADETTSLSGTITAMVVDTMPNGQLIIRGQKAVTASQGEQYLTLTGIVRPDDVGANNEISSSRVAQLRVAYTGSDTIGDAARPGWTTRFFMGR